MILDEDLLPSRFLEVADAELIENERLCPEEMLSRASARFAAVVSAEGGSPKMKNLMNAPMSMTTDNWPSKKPSVKESLVEGHCNS